MEFIGGVIIGIVVAVLYYKYHANDDAPVIKDAPTPNDPKKNPDNL